MGPDLSVSQYLAAVWDVDAWSRHQLQLVLQGSQRRLEWNLVQGSHSSFQSACQQRQGGLLFGLCVKQKEVGR